MLSPGCSLRHGPHQTAQKTRTDLPCWKSTVKVAPSRVCPESAGAAVPTRPLGTACETSGWSVQLLNSSAAARKTAALVDCARLGLAERSPKPEPRPGHPGRRRQQGLLEHFVDVPDQDKLHRLFDLVRHFVQVFAIFLRQDERFDPGSVGGQKFPFQPADWQDLP